MCNERKVFTGPLTPMSVTLATAEGITTTADLVGALSLVSCSSPRWDNLPSGHQRYPLLGINLGYMYWGQK